MRTKFSKLLSILLCLVMALGTLPTVALAAGSGYQDTDGHWAETAIDRWSAYGVLEGDSGNFNPDGALTRAQMAAILSRLLNLPDAPDAGFSDVKPDDWFAEYINKCAAAGIMLGDNGKANPNEPITRQQAIVMIARALGIQPIENPDLTKYADAAQVSAYAQGYVAALIEAGIVGGVTADLLAPQANINRASTVTILDRTIGTYANEAGETVKADGNGLTLIVAKDVKLTDVPEGTRIVVADGATGLTVNGKAVSDDQTYIVPETTTDTPSGGSSSSGGSSHTHSYTTEKVTKEPTCTEAGVKTLTCSCGATKTEEIPATGHSYDATTLRCTCGQFSSDAVAIIGENGYTSFKAALDAATDGCTIQLLKDVSISSQINTVAASAFTIDLNGKTITASNQWTLANSGPVTATMKNGTYQQAGDKNGSSSSGRIGAADGSNVTFSGMTFKSTDNYCCTAVAIYANNKTGAEITNTYKFTNCTFTNATVQFEGGSGSSNKFDATFDGCTFDATASANGMNLITMDDYNYGTLAIKNTTMNYTNTPSGSGGSCVYAGTYLDYTGGQKLNLKFENVTLNASGKAAPYYYRFMTYNGGYHDNAVVTTTGTNVFTRNGKNVEPAIGVISDTNKALVWTESAEAYQACYNEWKLFKNTSGSGYSGNNYYVVQYNDVKYAAKGLYVYESIAPYREGFICFKDGSNQYRKITGEDLSSSLDGENSAVKIYNLDTAYSVTLSDGTTSTVVDMIAKNEAYSYQLPAEFAAKSHKFVSTTGGTISETGLVTIPENKITSGVTITCYDGYKITTTGANSFSIYTTGSAGSKSPYYNKDATALKLQVNLKGVTAAYSISSITVGGAELDPSLYTVTPTKAGGTSFDVLFDKAALTGDIHITVLESPLYTEYKAVYNTLGNSKDTYSYLITDGTDYMLGYIGRVAEPSKVTVDGTKVYLHERYNSSGGTLTLPVPYTYEIGTEDISVGISGCSDKIKVYKLTNIYAVMVKQGQTVLESSATVKSGDTYTFTIPAGKILNSVSMGGAGGWSLTKDTHYTVDGNTVTINTSSFASDPKRADSYSINIFVKNS